MLRVRCLAAGLIVIALLAPVGTGGSNDAPRATNRVVLGELFTATWCGYCPAADNAFDKLLNNASYFPVRFIGIEWHPTSDAYGTQETDARVSYYGVGGYPTAVFDGVSTYVGGSTDPNSQAVYDAYKTRIDARPATSSFSIELEAKLINDVATQVVVNVTQVDTSLAQNLRVRAVILEDLKLTHNQGVLRYTVRDVIIDSALAISNGQTRSATGNGTVGSGWDTSRLAVAAWVQTETTKEVLQSAFKGSFERVVNRPPQISHPLTDLSFPEDTVDTSIDLNAVFTDPDGDELSFTYSGNFKINVTIVDGTVTLRPAKDWSGTETISFHALDPFHTNPVTEDIRVTITPVNDPPRVVKPLSDFSMTEGGTRSGPDLDDHFADVDSELSFFVAGGEKVTASIHPSTHIVTFTASDLWTGRETLTFTASDGELQASTTVNVTVLDTNHPPTPSPIPDITINEDSIDTSIDLNKVFTDLDGQETLTFEYWGNFRIAVTIMSDGKVELRPAPDWNGMETIIFRALDGIAEPAVATANVTVTPVNDPPVRVGQLERIVFDEDTTYTTERSLREVFRDVDGDELDFDAELEFPDDFEFNETDIEIIINRDGTVTVSPLRDVHGEAEAIFTASDPGGLEATYRTSVSITNVNDAPTITASDPPAARTVSINEGESVVFSVVASDADHDPLEYTWSVDMRVQDNPGSAFEYVPDYRSAGTHRVTVVVTDGVERVELTWTVKVLDVNRRPSVTIESPNNGAVFKSGSLIKFRAIASDPDGDRLFFKWVSDREPIGASEEFSCTLPSGTHTIEVEVSDGKDTATAQVIITVKKPTPPAAPGFGALAMAAGILAGATLVSLNRQWRKR
ncbi:MAG: tandem-95 repeat protein [Thermoplasmata archaeon]